MGVAVNFDAKQDAKQNTASALDRLTALLADDLKAVNRLIMERMDSPVVLIPQLAGHIVASGGKRLRPLLTLATARMCGYPGERHVTLATCVEFIHTATLLHDDVVDESDLRRGQDSANAIWGNKPSVLVGDFLFSRAFELMVLDGSLEVLRILSQASSVIAEGEVLQLITANDTTTDEAAYLAVIKAKTAELFAAACELGSVVADRPAHEQDALKNYGLNLGIAFQLIDDALDFSAKQATLGKTVGDDFRDGKITLPIILAFERAGEDERAFWRRTLEDDEQNDGDLEHAIALMETHGSLDDTVARAREYGNIARKSLDIFPDGEVKNTLLEVIDFCVERAY
ncbi:polyprenyl synthetase family protein [Varunaivibrio sulfuroxidans]|uniref:Octaprenyl diphosphate synthase n=1 Tax=Varunaivibrio sulfuroxidans TaxID=1773489 RepID=A0A4R3JAN0_9PROT|nr:polyprenyl synthetase family protein [Varunaivibrio sulfuroxidans]TCS62624.1 octaprenyl-diphosphate synthase [Varunaivibrio sulfuroxidans]WES30709.1 polyprenyl synthetase family protein [Varunaivibrio sulfuroxidans]